MVILENYAKQIYRCARCGWCRTSVFADQGIQKICPIYEYHPKGPWEFFTARGRLAIAQGLLEGEIDVTRDLVEIIYSCTTCGACHEICVIHFPVVMKVSSVDELDQVKVFEAMRAEVFKRAPEMLLEPHRRIAERISTHRNPYGEPHEKRFTWLPAVYSLPKQGGIVYFTGCTSPYRHPEICESTIKVLNKAGITPAIIDEWCCGSVLLRTGQWDYVKTLAEHNLEELKRSKAKKIIASCAGCYRTLKLDYPELLGSKWDFEVLHVTELIWDLIERGRLSISGRLNQKVTYHDPCHLGRHGGVYDPPRNIIESIPGIEFVEMKPTKQYAICCGGGGGVKSGFNELALRIGLTTVNRAKETDADILISACPFCKRNIVEAIELSRADIKFHDITEVLAKVV
ncbi:MAG: heterodisulfide reductase-related iron-sulfur binding cluster [Nitrososphaerota archaeon]|nr:heterodisulfide reductase-related iron-sulfur binding cluster [Candidatus Nezhaarchaeota archaeon]MDW8050031.1 heterodisulfide reductase-related iron-sulfur binding cluster [Nitrososphaerota archaeon]